MYISSFKIVTGALIKYLQLDQREPSSAVNLNLGGVEIR